MRIVYWDSDCILGWLSKEPDKFEKCEGTLEDARNGKVKICISAFTLTEVLWMKGKDRIPKEDKQKVRDFFDNDYFEYFDVDQWIGEYAQDLVWDQNVKPKDAIHVSTALMNNLPTLNTFDRKLINLDGVLKLDDGSGTLRICKPDIRFQESLKLPPDEG